MKPNFVHLHLHTEYSIVDGLVSIEPLVEAVAAAGMLAVAMTDQMNLFGMVKFYQAAMAAGIKPIIGADIWLTNLQQPKQPYRMVLLCQNQQGYRNLTRLLSKAYLEGQNESGIPIVQREWVAEASEGLIALSGGKEGDIGQALLSNNEALANQLLAEWLNVFPKRFYLELQRTSRTHETEYLRAAVNLAEKHHTPVVATNDVRFLRLDEFEAHEARVCIHEGWVLEDQRRPRHYTEQQYLRTPEEMQELFSDIPEALANTVEIAKRCNLELTLGQVFLPNFPVPQNLTMDDFFAQQAKEGLEKRFPLLFDIANSDFPQQRKTYDERLQMELDVIKRMGFAGYFLIVADFIRWAKEHQIPVGPGRGSGAGSLVAYALGITDLDPITHDLLFERFLNPERVSMPDFDIDFCMEGRDRVIEYVANTYGRESVSQIITYGTMAAKAVVRDVGRVLGFPYGFVDKIAKLIPFELGMTLKKAMQQEEQLLKRYHDEAEVKALLDLALKLEGITRNAGKHAGGVVIAPSVLTDFTPLYCEAGGANLVTQFDKDDIEAIGLVKFDFLGLRTLTIIDWAVQNINRKLAQIGETPIDITRLTLDDEKAFSLLKSCATTAIFQLESRGMKDLIRRLQPDCFDDIVALVALFRPGPLQSGMVDDFIDRKHGRAKVEYPHPLVEPILRPTYGVILYQEQVMQIAQVLGGYSLGNADLLRRAMGKKKPEEMAKHRALFVDGATRNGVDGHLANSIFDLMEKFAGYGFNKSHSAAYALITYQTAWLKTHYPAEFMAAVLSSDMDNTDKVVIFIEDCKNLKLTLLPPDINHSHYQFTVDSNSQIIYGLGAIKGMGQAAVETLVEERITNGVFTDIFNLCQRVDTRKVNRRALESLIRSGALDSFAVERASMMATLDIALQAAEQQARSAIAGQVDLFGNAISAHEDQSKPNYVAIKAWTPEERLLGEKETLGLYLSGHPITRHEDELMQFISTRIADLKPNGDQTVLVAGLIISAKVMNTKSGQRIAFLTLDDRTARVEVAVFTEAFQKYSSLIEKDQLVVVEGEVSVDDFTGGCRMMARKIYNLNQARETYAKRLWIKLHDQQVNNSAINELSQTLTQFKGGKCPVYVQYQSEQANAAIALGSNWQVRPFDQLLQKLQQLYGDQQVILEY